jgi:hypothetical protein
MTGNVDQPNTGGSDRSDDRLVPERARVIKSPRVAPTPIRIDPTAPVPSPIRDDSTIAVAAELQADFMPRLVKTQITYRGLVCSGLTGAEAAGLIGYVSGLAPAHVPWTMPQINRLLFLRNLYSNTEWGKAEREPAD